MDKIFKVNGCISSWEVWKYLDKIRLDKKELEKQENLRVLFTLMALGHKSDRAISKVLGVNNTTLSRRRKKLEQEGYIKEYTILPDFNKLGFNVIVISLTSTNDPVPPQHSEEFRKFLDKRPEILCILEDQGVSEKTWFSISVHKSYDDWLDMLNEGQKDSIMIKYKPQHLNIRNYVFRIGRHGTVVKQFSLRNLGDIYKSAGRLLKDDATSVERKTSPING